MQESLNPIFTFLTLDLMIFSSCSIKKQREIQTHDINKKIKHKLCEYWKEHLKILKTTETDNARQNAQI